MDALQELRTKNIEKRRVQDARMEMGQRHPIEMSAFRREMADAKMDLQMQQGEDRIAMNSRHDSERSAMNARHGNEKAELRQQMVRRREELTTQHHQERSNP